MHAEPGKLHTPAPGVRLVVTCAKAKRGVIAPELRLRSVRARGAGEAVAEWVGQLREAAGATVPVGELYHGDHWKAASDAAASAVATGGNAWVCSAGYGLVPFDAPVRPYSATFAPGDPDTVLRFTTPDGNAVEAVWWDALAGWEGPKSGSPRLVAEIAAAHPGDVLLVPVSLPYLRALTADLLAARAALADADRLIVLCGGAPEKHPLAENLVRWDARVQVVGGALVSMNARVAGRLLRELPPARLTLAAARERVAAWVAAAAPRTRPERRRVSDVEVREFIRERLTAGPPASPSGLHREFREAGLACERLRFLALFRSVSEE